MFKKKITTTIGELQDGDEVLGTDGKWHKIELLPIEEKDLYRVHTNKGSVVCSYDHYWCIDMGEDVREFSTIELNNDFLRYKGKEIGYHGSHVYLEQIEFERVGQCRCLIVKDTYDHQFQILTDENKPVFTHNCQTRIVCGQLGGVASQMALGNSLATTIDGSHKGAGIVSINNVTTPVQYYYADTSWIKDWYRERGFDENGYPLNNVNEEETVSLGDDEEEIDLKAQDQHFEFADVEKDIINRKEQKFRNV